jgi:hypothetical protein
METPWLGHGSWDPGMEQALWHSAAVAIAAAAAAALLLAGECCRQRAAGEHRAATYQQHTSCPRRTQIHRAIATSPSVTVCEVADRAWRREIGIYGEHKEGFSVERLRQRSEQRHRALQLAIGGGISLDGTFVVS